MNITIFMNELVKRIKEMLGDSDKEVEWQVISKNNGIKRYSIVIRKSDQKVLPNIYVDNDYQTFLVGDTNISEIAARVISIAEEHENDTLSSYYGYGYNN